MYLEHFGLKEMPFSITPDPRFLFYSQQHREAFDHLLYGIQNRKGFIEISGEVGSGKTTLCRAALSSLPETVQTALILNPSLTQHQLLRAILQDFGLEVNGGDRLDYIEQLNQFLLEQANMGHNVVVIIDEAQDLSADVMEEVRLLSNLETDQQKLMQIVLAGQPELREKLNSRSLRQLRQRILVRCHLGALTYEDTAQYIPYRLHVAGVRKDVGFDEPAVRLVYKHAKGYPRLINAICDLAMLAGYVAGKTVIGRTEIKKALVQMS